MPIQRPFFRRALLCGAAAAALAAGLGSSASGVLADDSGPSLVVAAAGQPDASAVTRVVDAPIALDDVQAAEPVPQPVLGVPSPAQPPTRLEPPLPDPPPADPGLATPGTARTNANCQAIEAEFLVQGAEAAVADQFAYVIAPRESGCVAQLVMTSTDLSYSRLGLNFIGAMPTYWGRLCGVADYHATAELTVDVRCGLAAYRALGWKPWS